MLPRNKFLFTSTVTALKPKPFCILQHQLLNTIYNFAIILPSHSLAEILKLVQTQTTHKQSCQFPDSLKELFPMVPTKHRSDGLPRLSQEV